MLKDNQGSRSVVCQISGSSNGGQVAPRMSSESADTTSAGKAFQLFMVLALKLFRRGVTVLGLSGDWYHFH